jgi:hypothetical protein
MQTWFSMQTSNTSHPKAHPRHVIETYHSILASIIYPQVNVYITMERSTMLSMGKSTISITMLLIAHCNSHYQAGYHIFASCFLGLLHIPWFRSPIFVGQPHDSTNLGGQDKGLVHNPHDWLPMIIRIYIKNGWFKFTLFNT